MFGRIKGYRTQENKIFIEFEHKRGMIEVLSSSSIRIFALTDNKSRGPSKAIEDLIVDLCSYSVEEEENNISISTNQLKIKVYDHFKVDIYDDEDNLLCEDYRGDREPFKRRNKSFIAFEEGHDIKENIEQHKIEILKKMSGNEYFYGLGETTGYLNKRGYRYVMWNSDIPDPHVESFESLYKSVPFFITIKDKKAYGIFFDNTHKTYFDMGKENEKYFYFASDNDNLDYYFIYGPTIKQVIKGYTYLTGTTPLPQLWTLGYQQCRWSYDSKERLMEIADYFRKRDIPCDVLYLDIDYMDGYRVFTWDEKAFPDYKDMIQKLKDKGFKIVTIIDPGVKKDKGYYIYEQGLEKGYFAKDKDGVPYVNKVWPGDALYPDFSSQEVRDWWSDNQKIMLDAGVSGIWNDMNEPASFNGPLPHDVQFENDGFPTDHREIHNVYGHLMSRSTYEGIKKYTNKRPFVITRACYSGTQKYSTIWTGDNQSLWEHLRMSIPMLLNLGLSGMTFAGTDVGGFNFDCTPELLQRWTQVGCFTPLFRNHSAAHTRDQEPWAFDRETEEVCRKYIELRYQLIPYLYDLMKISEDSGLPILRPLMLHYQNDEKTYQCNDQFLVGENMLVAPIVEQGQTIRKVYLPEGVWVDYWTKEEIEGNQYILKEAPKDVCPIFIKQGSIIPNYPVQNYIGEEDVKDLVFDVYPGNGTYEHYQDDGETFEYKEGKYNKYRITMNVDESDIVLNTELINQGYENKYDTFTFKINNVNGQKIKINGKEISPENIEMAKIDVFTISYDS